MNQKYSVTGQILPVKRVCVLAWVNGIQSMYMAHVMCKPRCSILQFKTKQKQTLGATPAQLLSFALFLHKNPEHDLTPLCIFPSPIYSNPLSAFCSHLSMENVLTSSPLSSMWATQDIFTLSSPGLSTQFTCFRKPSLEWWSSCCSDSPSSFSSSSSPSSEGLRSSGLGTGKHLSCVKPSF